jgi:hypothetical protein
MGESKNSGQQPGAEEAEVTDVAAEAEGAAAEPPATSGPDIKYQGGPKKPPAASPDIKYQG